MQLAYSTTPADEAVIICIYMFSLEGVFIKLVLTARTDIFVYFGIYMWPSIYLAFFKAGLLSYMLNPLGTSVCERLIHWYVSVSIIVVMTSVSKYHNPQSHLSEYEMKII